MKRTFSASSRFRHLTRRASAALKEGGVSLFARRLKRWAQHQRDRLLPSKAYQRWAIEHDATSDQLARQRDWAESLNEPPLISILCPLYRTPLPVLEQTIQSVFAQSYPTWQLCLTLCHDENTDLKAFLKELTNKEYRIQIIQLSENKGISENTNAAIRAARGDWVAFLDHDDLLAPDALYEVAHYIHQDPECQLIYSDEDLISADGKRRRAPMLKPDWSPEMLLHFNYICHFVAIRKTLLDAIGGLRREYDGAQDWDLLLRSGERTDRIHHIPKVLYHWRELATSTASAPDAKSYVALAQEQVLQDCLKRRGIEATIKPARFGHHRPVWNISDEPLVSVIIPSRNQPALIRQITEGLIKDTIYHNIEITIVDNGSTDADVLRHYKEWKQHGAVNVIPYNEPFNYSAACNRGAACANGEYLLFLNNDIEIIHRDWLNELLQWASLPEVGIVGPHLIYPDGRTQHAGIVLGLFELAGHSFHQCPPETYGPFGMAEWARNVTAVTGACQLVRKQLFQELGGFDEGYRLLYSDIELCLRAKQSGFRTVYAPHARLIHHECSTRKPGQEHQDDARRFAKMLQENDIDIDPYYHPALSANSKSPQFMPSGGRNVDENLARLVGIHLSAKVNEDGWQKAA